MRTFGRYRATGKLAGTEYADVFSVEDDEGRPFALKALRAEGIERALVDALFEREVAALEGWEHDGVVPLRDQFRHADGTPVLVFELVRGSRTMEALLRAAMEGRETREIVWRVIHSSRLVAAVGVAHARQAVHRDLKPSNLLHDVYDERLRDLLELSYGFLRHENGKGAGMDDLMEAVRQSGGAK